MVGKKNGRAKKNGVARDLCHPHKYAAALTHTFAFIDSLFLCLDAFKLIIFISYIVSFCSKSLMQH